MRGYTSVNVKQKQLVKGCLKQNYGHVCKDVFLDSLEVGNLEIMPNIFLVTRK